MNKKDSLEKKSRRMHLKAINKGWQDEEQQLVTFNPTYLEVFDTFFSYKMFIVIFQHSLFLRSLYFLKNNNFLMAIAFCFKFSGNVLHIIMEGL